MRILLIEDDNDLRKVLKGRLESECFVVDEAADGEQGSYLARTNTYDVIILDNGLPKKDGLQVCREIRKSEKHAFIIMLSVESEINRKIDLLNAGADDYMTKPFSFSELVARINAIARRPKKIEEDTITVGDITLDRNKHTIFRGSKEIYLTKKEFMLLEYLMSNHGNVLSRNQIMEYIWGNDTDPFSHTIETHILKLRNKLNGPKKKDLIHNIPGRGYKIEAL